jgi:hypothetical protein
MGPWFVTAMESRPRPAHFVPPEVHHYTGSTSTVSICGRLWGATEWCHSRPVRFEVSISIRAAGVVHSELILPPHC